MLNLLWFLSHIIDYVSNPGTPKFLNFALQDPARFVIRNNYIHSSSDVDNPQRFFTVGVTTYCSVRDLTETQRCRQLCLAPIGIFCDRSFTFAAKIFGFNTVNVTTFNNGVAFSTRMAMRGKWRYFYAIKPLIIWVGPQVQTSRLSKRAKTYSNGPPSLDAHENGV